MVGVPALLPHAAGLQCLNEVEQLGSLLRPARPFVAILGGAKVSDKIGVIRALAGRADALLIGGAMMFTFLAAKGLQVGRSKCERDKVGLARSLLNQYAKKIVLPMDVRGSVGVAGRAKTVDAARMTDSFVGLDIGEKTAAQFSARLRSAKTVFWNGPLGFVEDKRFARGTRAVARVLVRSNARRVAGGGDSAAFFRSARLLGAFDFVSTGGGAALSFVAGEKMPGLDALHK